jgi:hypothetical protein
MPDNLILESQAARLVIRCECGTIVVAKHEQSLVERTRLHFSEFHPDLGSSVPADLILAMAEEQENKEQ